MAAEELTSLRVDTCWHVLTQIPPTLLIRMKLGVSLKFLALHLLLKDETRSRDEYSAALYHACFQIWECKRSCKINFLLCILASNSIWSPEFLTWRYSGVLLLLLLAGNSIYRKWKTEHVNDPANNDDKVNQSKLDILKESTKQMI